jgi:hypothetical protein
MLTTSALTVIDPVLPRDWEILRASSALSAALDMEETAAAWEEDDAPLRLVELRKSICDPCGCRKNIPFILSIRFHPEKKAKR